MLDVRAVKVTLSEESRGQGPNSDKELPGPVRTCGQELMLLAFIALVWCPGTSPVAARFVFVLELQLARS